MAEQLTVNQRVGGSKPSWGAIDIFKQDTYINKFVIKEVVNMKIRDIIFESKNDRLIVRLSRLIYTFIIREMIQHVTNSAENIGKLGEIANIDWKSIPNGEIIADTEIWIVPALPGGAKGELHANTHNGNRSSLVFSKIEFDTSDSEESDLPVDDKRDIATIAHELRHLFDHVSQGTPDTPYGKSRITGDPDDEYYSSTSEINARTLEAKSNLTYALSDMTDISNDQLLNMIHDELLELEIEDYIPGGSDSKHFKRILKRLFVHGKHVLEKNKQSSN